MANPRPEVSGLRPRTATAAGGVKVVIRGENLGIDGDDLIGITICGIDHLTTAEWESSQKVIVTTLPVQMVQHPDTVVGEGGKRVLVGNVLVTTASGGQNQQTLQFTFEQEPEVEDEGDDSDIERDDWLDKPVKLHVHGQAETVRSTVVIEAVLDPLGIYTGEKSAPVPDPSLVQKVREIYPSGSGDPSNVNFIPAIFLVEKHSNTPLESLALGSKHLTELLERSHDDMCGLMKENFDRYVACQDAIVSVYALLIEHCADGGGDVLGPLLASFKKAQDAAQAFCKPLLQRRKRSASIRNVLGVMQRFKFLFTLPSVLDKAMANGEYEFAVSEYLKAQALYGKTEIDVFQRLMAEVNTIAGQLRELLEKKLGDAKTSLRTREQMIEYLTQLGTQADAAWKFMGLIRDNTCAMLNACAMQHMVIPENDETILRGRNLLETTEIMKDQSDDEDEDGVAATAQPMILYTKELTAVMGTLFARLWKLTQSYFHGNLSRGLEKLTEEKLKAKRTAMDDLLESIFVLYSKLIRTGFLPNQQEDEATDLPFPADSKSSVIGLLKCLQIVAGLHRSLARLKGITTAHLATLTTLVEDFECYAMSAVCDQATEAVKALWMYDLSLDITPSALALPEAFTGLARDFVETVAPLVRYDLSVPPRASLKSGEDWPISSSSKALPLVAEMLSTMLELFADCLRSHAFTNTRESTQGPGRRMSTHQSKLAENRPSPKNLLLILGSTRYTRDMTIPQLNQIHLSLLGVSLGTEELQGLVRIYHDLEEDVARTYIDITCEALSRVVADGLELQALASRNTMPKGVRAYIPTLALQLVVVHWEVHSMTGESNMGSDSIYTAPVLSKVIDKISEVLYTELRQSSYTTYQYAQLHLDLTAFYRIITRYRTPVAQELLERAMHALRTNTQLPQQAADSEEILTDFLAGLRFQLSCLMGPIKRLPHDMLDGANETPST